MIIAMRSQMCRQVVLLIEAFVAEAALEGLFTRVSSLRKYKLSLINLKIKSTSAIQLTICVFRLFD